MKRAFVLAILLVACDSGSSDSLPIPDLSDAGTDASADGSAAGGDGGAAGAAGAAGASGASGDAGTGGTGAVLCVPGVQIACACPGGFQGAQACLADASGYGMCDCGGGVAGGGGAGGGSASAGSGTSPVGCVPGQQIECACGSGMPAGYQVCASTGASFSSCMCGSGAAGAGGSGAAGSSTGGAGASGSSAAGSAGAAGTSG